MPAKTVTHEFKAEVKQLLDILVHSLYTQKEIFLRELVSNASDALDKYRFATQLAADKAEDDASPEIRIEPDADKGLLVITDTGVGMTEEEVVRNIGTIAHSGSAEFLRQATEGTDAAQGLDSLIGRFGVGFYSVYMVADEVTLTTRSYQADAVPVRWRSDGRGAYEIGMAEGEVPRGTRIEVRLKKDLAKEFTDADTLKRIIEKHSNFISHPIFVAGERVNTVPALWREPKFKITKEQYKEFYSFLTFDTEEPLLTMHVSVDAPVQFNSLVFVPKRNADILGMQRDNWGLDLYVRRVLIERQNKDLLPQYLAFAKGVVDTEDLPLNISRETLQDNILMRKINSTLVKDVLGQLTKLAKEDADTYAEFWNEHGKVFRLGYNDYPNRERFASLLRFNSSLSQDEKGLVSFEEYIARAKEGQKEIYFLFGPSREAARLNPHLEVFRDKGLEVLYLFDPADEFIMDALREFKGFKLKPAEHARTEDLEKFPLVREKKKPKLAKKDAADFERMLARFKEILGERVTEVRATERLSESPCRLANPNDAATSSMDKVMRAITRDTSIPKKIFEVNPGHALIRNLLAVFRTDGKDAFLEKSVLQLYETALLLEGYLADPHALVARVQDLLTESSGWYAEKKA